MKTLCFIIALSSCVAVAGRIERDPVTGERVLVPISQEVLNERRAQNAAREAAEAQALGLPAIFDTGIAVIDDEGHHVKYVPLDGDVVPIRISNSPIDPNTAKQMERGAKIAERERVAAIMDIVKTVRTNTVDLIQARTWTNQNAGAQAEQIEYLLKAVRDLSTANLKMLRGK